MEKGKTKKVNCNGCDSLEKLREKHNEDLEQYRTLFKEDIKCEVAKEVSVVIDERLKKFDVYTKKMDEIYPRIEKDIKFGKAVEYIFEYVKELKASAWIKGVIILSIIIVGIFAGLRVVIAWLGSIKLWP